jgi:ubiquinone biosynthesis protein
MVARDLRRLLQLVWLLLRHAAAHFVLRRPRGVGGPDRLRLILEDVGGTCLKFGQVLALQPDILPREYCNALFDLLDRVPPFGPAEVNRVFAEELGRSPGEIFDSFDPVPLASASIGQVHVALRDGEKLAVKVQRPDLKESFAPDLRVMRAVAQIIYRLRWRRLYWLRRALEEFVSWTREELDYRYEARYMAALGYNAEDNPRESIPRVVDELTTPRILVAEFLEGPMVVDYIRAIEAGTRHHFEAELAEEGFDPERFARNIVRNFVSDAFHHGLFHADLHPANLLIRPDSVVGYVDFGITGSLSAHSRRNLVALTLALTRADLDAMMEYFLRVATTTADSDVPEFKRGLAELIEDWYDTDRERPVFRENFTRVMIDMLQLSRRTDVVPTPDVIRYIRSVITADGLITRFAPKLHVGRYLEEICEDYLRRETWREWLSVENLADWTAQGARLLAEAPATMVAVLRGLTTVDEDEDEDEDSRDGDRIRALQWALTALAGALVVIFSGGDRTPGVNLFSASLALSAVAATMFLATIRRIR